MSLKNYKILKKIKKNIFIIEKNDNKYFLKQIKNPRAGKRILANLIDVLGLTQIHFQKELCVLKQMAEKEYDTFKYPKLIESDNSSYFITEFIDGNNFIKFDLPNKTIISSSLVEFQINSFNVHFGKRCLAISLFCSPGFQIIRSLIFGAYIWCGFKNSFKIHKFLIKVRLSNKKLAQKLLLHRDLGQYIFKEAPEGFKRFQNLMCDKYGKIYFIDFGSVQTSNKFIMGDIIKLSFDILNNEIDKDFINCYLTSLNKTISIDNINLKDEVKLYIILILLKYMQYPKYRLGSYKFLNETILINSNYNKWFNKMFS